MSSAGNRTLTTSGTSQQVSPAQFGRRISFSITNYGTTVAWVCQSDNQTAAVGVGVPLYPGQTMADSSSDIYRCWQGRITAVDDGSGGATTLAIFERVML